MPQQYDEHAREEEMLLEGISVYDIINSLQANYGKERISSMHRHIYTNRIVMLVCCFSSTTIPIRLHHHQAMDLHPAMVHPNINHEIRNRAAIAPIVINRVFV